MTTVVVMRIPSLLMVLGFGMVLQWGSPARVLAHERSPSALLLHERPDGAVEVTWSLARAGQGTLPLTLQWPERCTTLTQPKVLDRPRTVTTRWHIHCGPEGLEGATLAVEGLDRTGTDVIVRLERPDDDIRTQVLQRRRPSWTIPPPQARPTFPWSYVPIGVEHVLLGLDHLLIVLALVWLTAGHVGPLLGSLTAFTLGHSLTLIGITLLPALQPPSASVEAWIALTLLAAALEMDRHDPRKGPAEGQRSHLFWGAFAVGLLHGLGFAGALAQLGWPDEARVWAVLLFNLGVEVGQIGVVAGLLVLARGLGGWVPEPWIKLPVYLTGALGAFWTFQRALAIVMG